jgi:hypothetical protein
VIEPSDCRTSLSFTDLDAPFALALKSSRTDPMYKAFENMRNLVKTETNSRIYLEEDPKSFTGEFTRYVSYISYGTMEVITQPQILTTWGEGDEPVYMLPWYIENMKGEGASSLGAITVVGSPELMTTGVIRQNARSRQFPATLEASVFQVFEIPGYGKLHHKAQVVISGVVDAIPPFHALCKCSAAILYDDHNRTRGIVDGRALTILPMK